MSRKAPLVAIGGYCLMPNHIHLLLREIVDGGISKFMHKVGTGYTMYFNILHQRVGNLFVKPFRSKHIGDDTYLQHASSYLHLNPAELFEAGWKHGVVTNMHALETRIREYRYSSLPDFYGSDRPESAILDQEFIETLALRPLRDMLSDAHEYYADSVDMIEKLR